MNKAIIKLYVDEEDLTKQLEIIFDNGYSYAIVEKVKLTVGLLDKIKYYVEAHIGEPNESNTNR